MSIEEIVARLEKRLTQVDNRKQFPLLFDDIAAVIADWRKRGEALDAERENTAIIERNTLGKGEGK